MKKIVLIIFLIVNFSVFGQINNESELIGKWKVEKKFHDPVIPEVKPIFEGFLNSTFEFKRNKEFELISISTNEQFNTINEKALKGTKWKFTKQEQIISIGSPEDNFSSMVISLRKKEGKIYFYLEEIDIILLVVKVE